MLTDRILEGFPMMRLPEVLLLTGGILLVGGCNESSSDGLGSERIVLNGDLVVDGAYVRMKVNLGKENSSVIVVLQGGDTIEASDGSTSLRMDYASDIFESYYRAAFPVSTSAPYAVTLNRFSDGSSMRSAFPAVPGPFAITAPADAASMALSSSPVIPLTWDVAIASTDLLLNYSYDCEWQLSPAPADEPDGRLDRSTSGYQFVTTAERNLRRVNLNAGDRVNLQRAQLVVEYPTSAVVLRSCSAAFSLEAKNDASAHAELSADSHLSSRRHAGVGVTLLP